MGIKAMARGNGGNRLRCLREVSGLRFNEMSSKDSLSTRRKYLSRPISYPLPRLQSSRTVLFRHKKSPKFKNQLQYNRKQDLVPKEQTLHSKVGIHRVLSQTELIPHHAMSQNLYIKSMYRTPTNLLCEPYVNNDSKLWLLFNCTMAKRPAENIDT